LIVDRTEVLTVYLSDGDTIDDTIDDSSMDEERDDTDSLGEG